MLEKIALEKVLFLDIETVPQHPSFTDMDETSQKLFDQKTKFLQKEGDAASVFDRAGIYAEFGKIICISVGFVRETRMGKEIRMKSFFHDDEETLLHQFVKLIEEHFNSPYHLLCGHNAKEFDIPFICRRMLIHGMKLPSILDIAGKKPWEIAHLDTMELWKFGDYKAYTSLALLCHIFNIPTPKDDISGADVARVYYENEKGEYPTSLERIKVYCEKDVVALIQLFLRFRGENLVDEGSINYSE
jgi:uncharacterized protein YprB with RNaseH-like and TPR domain